jgi:hypothetical protein
MRNLANCLPAIDHILWNPEIEAFIKQQRRTAQKKLDYPETTAGSQLASKARKLASKLKPEHTCSAMFDCSA